METVSDAPLANLGGMLYEARKSKKISRAQVAKAAGCSVALITQYEQGTVANPREDILQVMAQICGLDWNIVFRSLIEEKYGVDYAVHPHHLAQGDFYEKTTLVVQQIRENASRCLEAWFAMNTVGSKTAETRNQYCALLADLINQWVHIELILPNTRQSLEFREQIIQVLQMRCSEARVNMCLRFPIQHKQNTAPVEEENPMYLFTDEFYFATQKPFIAMSGDIRGFQSFPNGGLIEGHAIEFHPENALRRFHQLRSQVYGLETEPPHASAGENSGF